jgi:CBS domain-containing protein
MSFDLRQVRVGDCMHHGILSCDAGAPLDEVAAIMATHRVHAVAVTNGDGQRVRAIVSDIDVVAAAAGTDAATALEIAATEPLAVSAGESVQQAARLMSEHGVSHLVVLDAQNGHPTGVLSTLDVAVLYANMNGDPQ